MRPLNYGPQAQRSGPERPLNYGPQAHTQGQMGAPKWTGPQSQEDVPGRQSLNYGPRTQGRATGAPERPLNYGHIAQGRMGSSRV